MHPNHDSFSVEIPVNDSEEMVAFNKILEEYQDECAKYIEELSRKLGISFDAAGDIWYLRGRSRWTQEKEDYLILLAKNGKPLPNMCEDFEVPPK